MDALEVFDPSGSSEVTQLHAPRLDSLDGKTIGFISNDMWLWNRANVQILSLIHI